MLQCWQKSLLVNRRVFRQEFATSGSVELELGRYRITAIGAGGGGSAGKTAGNTHGYAKGGVGGTLVVDVVIRQKTQVNVTIGTGGTSAFTVTNLATAAGTTGGNTTVSGIPNVQIIAAGGTGGSTKITGRTTERTPGVQGVNTAAGNITIIENNKNQIISYERPTPSSTTSRMASYQYNTNYTDGKKGGGGDTGWSGDNFTPLNGGNGFVVIESAD